MQSRLEVYKAQTEPLIAYYSEKGILKTVDGMQSIADVFGDIVKVLG